MPLPHPTAAIAERFDMISRQDFAALAGKSLRTIDRWHALGIGPARTAIGRTPYYRLEAVKAWLLDNEVQRCPPRRRR